MGILGNYLPNWLPEDPNQNAAARQGLLAFGAGLLGGRGDLGGILGDGLMAGSQTYNGALAQQQQTALRQAQMQQVEVENKQRQAAIDKPMQLQRILTGGAPGQPNRLAGLPKIGDPPRDAAPAPAAEPAHAPAAASSTPGSMYETLMDYGNRLSQAGYAAEAVQYFERAEKLRPKLKEQRTLTVDGKRVMANVFEDGTTQQLDGFAPDAEKLNFQNTGGSTVALDPFTGKPVNTIRNTQSPDSVASVAATMRGQNMIDSRAREQLVQGKTPTGYRWAENGELEPIPGGPATKSATSTEGERKAATLLMRLQGSEKQLEEALSSDPRAAKPGVIAQGLRAVGAEALANSSAVSDARQRVEAAQLDILDSALTLGTGAAYTREQLESYRRSYFPQLGDTPRTVADKHARLANVIEAAKIAAGRAAAGAEQATANTIKSVKDLPKKAGIPAGWTVKEK